MKQTDKNRVQNSIAWPELSEEEIAQLMAVNACGRTTIFRRYAAIKAGDPVLDNISLALSEIISAKRKQQKEIASKITQQLSAA